MAAAYAALVSLTHIIDQIMEHHARHPVFMDKQQRQIESLQQKVSFLQHFLEVVYYNGGSNEAQGLTSRIAVAAYAAQDIIESHNVDNILSKRQANKNKNGSLKFTSHGKNSSNHFSQLLQKVIENIDCIKKEIAAIKGTGGIKDQLPRGVVPVVLSRSPTTEKDTTIEYYDEHLEQIMDKLTGQSSNLQIIPIVGMGGIGKTTLARNIFDNPLVVECFYVRAWVTISQEYNLREMFLCLLQGVGLFFEDIGEQDSGEYHQLGEKLHKHLSGRKYLIVMDDLWSTDVLEKLKLFLPDNSYGSRVMVTTRLSHVANSFGSYHFYEMNLLDENKSWSLLCRKVFGHVNCPSELEEIGKEIAKNCKGLPLSIVVVGGLLAKSDMTLKYWEYVAQDISQIVNSEENGHWLKILSLSYSNLPIHLKPCFLYMGVYQEDFEIRISKLIKLWVAEGFLKPNKAKSLEEVAMDYLNDLVERNLIFVRKWGSIGKIKVCGIHDLLRDLCLKEAQKERFFSMMKVHHAQSVNNEDHMPLTPLIRSLSCDIYPQSSSRESETNLRLLRILVVSGINSLKSIRPLVNLRYLECGFQWGASTTLSQVFRLRFLQTLIFTGYVMPIVAPSEIWEMPQLRHIVSEIGICLPDPLRGQMDRQDRRVLENLQTLPYIHNFKCTEEILIRIPNITKLSIMNPGTGTSNCFSLHNLCRLHKLQSLTCYFVSGSGFLQNLAFPQWLKKLKLWNCHFNWDDFTITVGSLPHLEKLMLYSCTGGAEWNTVEESFLGLIYLEINSCKDLVCWTAESTHFPLLECLVLRCMSRLEEIPSGIGDTLQSLKLEGCKSSAIASAKEILEEQQSLGNDSLRLTIRENGFVKFHTTTF